MSVIGSWNIVSSPDFDDDYLSMEGVPYVKLQQTGNRVTGEYHFALSTGDLDGRPAGEGRVTFSFEGMDEMDEVNGAATAALEGDRLIFKLMYHQGDEYTFECERA